MKTHNITTVVDKSVIDAKSKVCLRHWDDQSSAVSVQTKEAEQSQADLWNVRRWTRVKEGWPAPRNAQQGVAERDGRRFRKSFLVPVCK